eukprot:TRINITY_DN5778_c0_g1_i1.p1 TRINITY_DN5778_c0_g1~~TRINITY_DN5778_c0_g1_i1.p1  ORF type:complete len:493 (-),score=68.74 TRINITY_DN5778_c0_g1_i1:70-1548(-)
MQRGGDKGNKTTKPIHRSSTCFRLLQCIGIFILIVSVFIGYLTYLSQQYYFQDFSKFKTGDTWNNWAHIHSCKPLSFQQPKSEQEIIDIVKSVKNDGERVKVVGAGHSWMNITCGKNTHLLNFDRYNKILKVDKEKKFVTVESGITELQLFEQLEHYGLSLPIGTVPNYFTIAGVINTASHGMSTEYGSISSLVEEMWIIDAKGELIYASREHNKDIFDAARCGVGLIGILSRVTLKCVDYFNLDVSVFRAPDDFSFQNHFGQAQQSLTVYFPYTGKHVIYTYKHTTAPPSDDAYTQALVKNITYDSLTKVIQSLSVNHRYLLKPWYQLMIDNVDKAPNYTQFGRSALLPGHTLDMTSEIEYMIPIQNIDAAFREVIQTIESSDIFWNGVAALRPVRSDSDIWLSPFYNQDSVSIEIELVNQPNDRRIEKLVIDVMRKHGGRPHWGKQFHIESESDITSIYEKWSSFKKVYKSIDPNGKFLSEFWERILVDN